MDNLDKKLLNLLQEGLPLTESPFLDLAEGLKIPEEEVLFRIRNLKEERVIREISAIFNTRRLGYESALVGMKIPEELLDNAGETVSRHPGVSHNYSRNHPYNLWFTIAIAPGSSMEETLKKMGEEVKAEDVLLLPSKKLFKIGVKLNMMLSNDPDLSLEEQDNEYDKTGEQTDLSESEVRLIKELQNDFPVEKRPFKEVAAKLSMDEKEVLKMAIAFEEKKIMRRLAAVLFHREAGFTSNMMVAWEVPLEKVKSIGKKMASYKAISHCYERKSYPHWPYTVYTMIHCRSEEECESIINNLSKETGIEKFLALKTDKEYKKVRLKYYTE